MMSFFWWLLIVVILTFVFGTWILGAASTVLEFIAGLFKTIANSLDFFGWNGLL